MEKIINPVNPVLVSYRCNECLDGTFVPKDITLWAGSNRIPHGCNNFPKCKNEAYFTKTLPALVFVKENEEVPDLLIKDNITIFNVESFTPD